MLFGSPSIKVDDKTFLKPLRKKDAKDLFQISIENQEELKKWFAWASDVKLEKTKKFIETSKIENKNNKRCDLGVFYKNKLAGIISLIHGNLKTRDLELAYWLAKKFSGSGIMTKACKTIIHYCFEKLNFEEIFVEFFPDNKKSHALAKRMGFQLENFASKARIINDKRSFYICYSLKKEDFENRFWENLDKILKRSKIVIDYKKGEIYKKRKDIICPVNFGHLENEWSESEELDILIGSGKKSEKIDTILCTIDLIHKFSDIKILYGCTESEKMKLFEIFNELQGSILVEK